MPTDEIAFHIQYAAVHAIGGGDPTADAAGVLRDQRVLAALREHEGGEVVVLIPVTESGGVLALDADDRLRFDLSVGRLQELFAARALQLRIDTFDDALDEMDSELDDAFGEAFEELDADAMPVDDIAGYDATDDPEAPLFAPLQVRVAEFSRRGPWAARITAQLLGADVDYIEHDAWSAYLYRTGEPHAVVTGGGADGAVIELNVPEDGEAWVEVSVGSRTEMFWPNAERTTTPALNLDDITDPASAEVYRRMLAEADGTRDELRALASDAALDADAAHRACMPEAVGGVVGERERLSAFVAAFGVPDVLIARALAADAGAAAQRFRPRGWPAVLGDLLVGGMSETTPLTRRDRPIARLARMLRERPLLGAAVSVAELAAGVGLARGRSRLGRGVGVFVVIDALADLVIWTVRMRRR